MLHLIIDRTSRLKIHKETADLNNTMDQMDQTTHKTSHLIIGNNVLFLITRNILHAGSHKVTNKF